MDNRLFLGVDIGGTNIRVGLVDEAYHLIEPDHYSTRLLLGEDSVDALIRIVRGYLDKTGCKERVAAITVGIPGTVDKDHNHVYGVTYIHGLQGIPLGQLMQDAFGIPVFVEHDVVLLMLHDIRSMDLDPERNKTIIGCYIGTGFGNALYVGGRMHFGAHGVSGELGHIPLYGVEDACSCGSHYGCAETRCCGRYLEHLVAQEFPDCHIGDIFLKHGNDPRIRKFVQDCALPIATEITILDPDLVILGGGVIAMQGFPTKYLEAEIRRLTRHPLPANDIHFVYTMDGLVFTSNGQNTGVIGGGMAAMEHLAGKL